MELIINPTLLLLLPYFCKLPSVNQEEINDRGTVSLNQVGIGWGDVNNANSDSHLEAP